MDATYIYWELMPLLYLTKAFHCFSEYFMYLKIWFWKLEGLFVKYGPIPNLKKKKKKEDRKDSCDVEVETYVCNHNRWTSDVHTVNDFEWISN